MSFLSPISRKSLTVFPVTCGKGRQKIANLVKQRAGNSGQNTGECTHRQSLVAVVEVNFNERAIYGLASAFLQSRTANNVWALHFSCPAIACSSTTLWSSSEHDYCFLNRGTQSCLHEHGAVSFCLPFAGYWTCRSAQTQSLCLTTTRTKHRMFSINTRRVAKTIALKVRTTKEVGLSSSISAH